MSSTLSRVSKYSDNLFLLLIIASLLYFLIDSISIALTQPFSFDGAINAQAAKELGKDFAYATTYNGINKFDPSIQTGLPVILPVAIFFKLFGLSFESGLFVNVIYINLLLLAVLFYLKYCLKLSNPFILLSILIFFSIPDLELFGYGLYGEIPALFYFFLAVILLHFYEKDQKIKFALFAGLCIGMGYLTKTVMLISLPALFFIEVFDYFFIGRRNLLSYIKKSGMFVLGFVIPVLIFEIYKLTSLGTGQYISWWGNQVDAILMQAGVKSGYSDTSGLIAKISLHFDLLATYLRINTTWLGVLLLFIFFSFVGALAAVIIHHINSKGSRFNRKQIIPNSAIVILVVTLSYFGWWLLITSSQKAFYRRIFDGTILLDICLVIFLSYLYILVRKMLEGYRGKNFIYFGLVIPNIILMLMVIASIYGLIHSKNGMITFTDSPGKSAALRAGNYINTLPTNADIYGYGWWQAPVISFTSGKNFKDLSKYMTPDYPELNDAYLAIDSFEYTTPDLYEPILNEYDSKLVFFDNNIYIYKLNSR